MTTFTVKAASKKKDVDGKHGPMQVIALGLWDDAQGLIEAEWFTKASTPLPAQGSTLEGDLEDGPYGKKFKKSFQGGGGRGRSPEDTKAIQRQHSQEMALRLMAAFEPVLEGRTAKTYLPVVKMLTDWFEADIGSGLGGGQGEGTVQPSASPPAPAVESSVGFSSDKQKTYFQRLLKEAGGSTETVLAITAYAETQPNVSRWIDGLKDNPKVTAKALAQDANEWARNQSDVPADERDLPALESTPEHIAS